ncbi:hypothetical protein Cgig2_013508 [Carnegiea gigantea]|uniref:Uncharacterized protein n=1 Tax=Carnegiea gigantea TaxID=171969 RepID=A0A9Q1GQU9_9CARY|nr:hypothetical protein Cgig2_013508 [Carnegiea gigantea]
MTMKVISECFVRPQHEVEEAKRCYHLSPGDMFMLSIDPIQKGLLFSFEEWTDLNRPDIESLVKRLKRALSIALVEFYPLAGRFETIKYEDEHACSVYIDCCKGPGARLVHASYVDLTVSDILSSTDVHPAIRSFFDLGEKMVNYDGHTKALLSIQVTELLEGVFIGFTMNHSVVDGTLFIHFVSTLSEIYRSDLEGITEDLIRISRVPLYKMFAPDGYGPIFKVPYLEPEEFVIRYDPGLLRERIFHFSHESMARLKAKANGECGTQDISSFMALSGLEWKSIIQARSPEAHEKTACYLLLNARTRLDPPLSDDYLGNFLRAARVECNVDELLGRSLGRSARLSSPEVKKHTHETICQFIKWRCDHLFVMKPANSIVIGGLARFDMYGPEFGLGRAVAVRMGFANKDNGKVTANPGCEGRGSADLEICLRPPVMSTLEADEVFMDFAS